MNATYTNPRPVGPRRFTSSRAASGPSPQRRRRSDAEARRTPGRVRQGRRRASGLILDALEHAPLAPWGRHRVHARTFAPGSLLRMGPWTVRRSREGRDESKGDSLHAFLDVSRNREQRRDHSRVRRPVILRRRSPCSTCAALGYDRRFRTFAGVMRHVRREHPKPAVLGLLAAHLIRNLRRTSVPRNSDTRTNLTGLDR